MVTISLHLPTRISIHGERNEKIRITCKVIKEEALLMEIRRTSLVFPFVEQI